MFVHWYLALCMDLKSLFKLYFHLIYRSCAFYANCIVERSFMNVHYQHLVLAAYSPTVMCFWYTEYCFGVFFYTL